MNHENTRIYKRSIELNQKCAALVAELPTGLGFLADEIRRAGASVTLNFAEGNGRNAPRERKRFFIMAAASAMEVSAAVDIAHLHRAINDSQHADLKATCNHVAAMLHLFR